MRGQATRAGPKMTAMSSPHLYGRERELAEVGRVLDAARHRGAALVVQGDPGIGKSSVLRYVRDEAAARDFEVLSAAGVPSETGLPFAGLHQMLRPVLDRSEALPDRLRQALLAAFGMADEDAPDRFLIALATLELLADATARRPIVVVADDAQWLDEPSVHVLGFVARRIESDRIVIVSALLSGYDSPLLEAAATTLTLGPLDATSAGALVDADGPTLSATARQRLLSASAGNPLALVELRRSQAVVEVDAEGPLPNLLPLSARLEQAFAARLPDLSPTARRVLLVLAIDERGDLQEALAAAARLEGGPISVDSLAHAVDAGLVVVDGPEVRFRHPLVRSAVHLSASFSERCAAHESLAAVIDTDPDRTTWHRAAAAIGSDERIAHDLEAAAERARHRGAFEVAVAALERAGQLTRDPRLRADRQLRAAELAFDLGRRDLVRRLLASTDRLVLDPINDTRAALVRELVTVPVRGDSVGVASLVDRAMRAAAHGPTDRVPDLLLAAAFRCWWTDPDPDVCERVVEALRSTSKDWTDHRTVAALAITDPMAHGALVMQRVADADRDGLSPADARLLAQAAFAVGDLERAAHLLARAATGLRAQGRLGLLTQVLVLESTTAVHMGRWTLAQTAGAEALRLAQETGQPVWAAGAQVTEALLAGMRGETALANALADQAERTATGIGNRSLLAGIRTARARIALGGGDPERAFHLMAAMFDPADGAFHHLHRVWAIGDLAEAAVQTGHREEARAFTAVVERLALATPSPRTHAALRYARALLADDTEARSRWTEATGAEIAAWPFEQARAWFGHARWLRRHRHLAESRPLLRAARDAFDRLGAVPWAGRVREELRAAGEASSPRPPRSWERLSPQELQIAQLASEGRSNREIGERLFLSPRTVGSHLYRAFPKLGITSRSQLAGVLGDLDAGTSDAA